MELNVDGMRIPDLNARARARERAENFAKALPKALAHMGRMIEMIEKWGDQELLGYRDLYEVFFEARGIPPLVLEGFEIVARASFDELKDTLPPVGAPPEELSHEETEGLLEAIAVDMARIEGGVAERAADLMRLAGLKAVPGELSASDRAALGKTVQCTISPALDMIRLWAFLAARRAAPRTAGK